MPRRLTCPDCSATRTSAEGPCPDCGSTTEPVAVSRSSRRLAGGAVSAGAVGTVAAVAAPSPEAAAGASPAGAVALADPPEAVVDAPAEAPFAGPLGSSGASPDEPHGAFAAYLASVHSGQRPSPILSVGAVPASSVRTERAADPRPQDTGVAQARPTAGYIPPSRPLETPERVSPAPDPPAAQAPFGVTAVSDPRQAPRAVDPPTAVRDRSSVAPPGGLMRDIATFGFVVAGASLGFASFFLPWTSQGGLVIGVHQNNGTEDSWGWAAPVTPLLILLALITVFAPLGAERVAARFPRAAVPLVRLTEVALPMILAGVAVGVAVMYLTWSYGFGSGPLVYLLGGGLAFAGAFVALIFPADRPRT